MAKLVLCRIIADGGIALYVLKSKCIQYILISLFIVGTASIVANAEAAAFDHTELIKESVVYAKVLVDTPAFNDWANGRKQIGEFAKGEVVEVIRDRSFEWYLVSSEDSTQGWISVASLDIPSDPETNTERLPDELVETYVNKLEINSKTDHLVWVDIDRQLTHVFTGRQGEWKLTRTMPCSTGKNVSPTLRGVHEVAERGEWFFAERFGRGGENWVQFSGPYMFHSLPMDRQGNILDYTLLERRSSGCIRLSMEDSRWFYSFIKRRTTVFVQ